VVAVKAHQADSFLKAPDVRLAAVLLYGSDAGLVLERGQMLAKLLSRRDNPPGEILRFEDGDLDDNPDRLAVELQTMPMFGGRKIIRANAGRRISGAALKPLIDGGGLQGFLIVEAGNLKPDDSLRALFEKAAHTAAVACFPDEDGDLANLVTRALQAHGLRIGPDARDLLVSRLGADRALSRSEIDKLALYALGATEVSVDDVDAVVGDASDLQLDHIPQAAASGDAAAAVADADRASAAGESAQSILLATQRYFLRLHRLRAAIEQGRSPDEAVRQLRPPVHFKQQGALAAQARAWSAARLAQAVAEIGGVIKATRATGALEDILAERLLLKLAFLARAKG
jgi:DNA polymerase III subunit delta